MRRLLLEGSLLKFWFYYKAASLVVFCFYTVMIYSLLINLVRMSLLTCAYWRFDDLYTGFCHLFVFCYHCLVCEGVREDVLVYAELYTDI